MRVWVQLPAVDPAKLVPAPPAAVQIFMQRINANYPPSFYKGIPIDASHFLRKHLFPSQFTPQLPPQLHFQGHPSLTDCLFS